MECRTIGLIALYVFVAFMVYVLVAIPPGSHWDGDIKWGDVGAWVSGVGTLATAVIAVWVARKPTKDRRKQELAFSAAVSPALGIEAAVAEREARQLASDLERAVRIGTWDGVAQIRGLNIRKLSLTHRIFERLDWFTAAESLRIAYVVATHAELSEDVTMISTPPRLNNIMPTSLEPRASLLVTRAAQTANNLADGLLAMQAVLFHADGGAARR